MSNRNMRVDGGRLVPMHALTGISPNGGDAFHYPDWEPIDYPDFPEYEGNKNNKYGKRKNKANKPQRGMVRGY